MSATFTGFSEETLRFLRELKAHNSKDWFEEHREEYDRVVAAPLRAFVEAIGAGFKERGIDVVADPREDQSIIKIRKSTRFSVDKSPYKNHLALFFWQGERDRMENPGYYLEITDDGLLFGVGHNHFPKDILKKYRNAVVDTDMIPEFEDAIESIHAQGFNVGGKHYNRIPQGYNPEHKLSEYLLYNGLYSEHRTEIPEVFFTADFVDYCIDIFMKMKPLEDWVVKLYDTYSIEYMHYDK